jgi:ubiquinone/menaquinone biosynthesis C-methylase UbiE
LVLLLAGVAALLALLYWQLIIAEGAYLGPRVVAWTYDLVASRYDAIKQFRPRDESWFVARPVLRRLRDAQDPLVLDVATGTGRLPHALLQEHFSGQIIGLDLSRQMLDRARDKLRLYDDQVSLVWQDAGHLPFAGGTFDAVTCLESLEFMPRPLEVLGEMVRVLAPGGLLLVTNRVGREARLLPGRAIPRPEFEAALTSHRLVEIEVRRWQENYDLASARKATPPVLGSPEADRAANGDLLQWLRCPACDGPLARGVAALTCSTCQQAYPIRKGVVHLARP